MHRLTLRDAEKCVKVTAALSELSLTAEQIERTRAVFLQEMELALAGGQKAESSSLQMENTYIPPHLLDGTEDDIYLAMDLGGTNLRLLLLRLIDGRVAQELVQHYPLSNTLRIGCARQLFDYLASCLDAFAREQQLDDGRRYALGFTFSFPMRHMGLDAGVLITWTKSFDCPSAVGVNVVELLRAGLMRCGRRNIDVVAILNDTTGTLVHGIWLDPRTRIGVVLGTGTNGCYMENAALVPCCQAQEQRDVILDVEWGAFGDNGVLDFIRTDYDRQLDAKSLLRGSFTFEKYISGKYLGELCRLVLQRLHAAGLFLATLPALAFPQPYTFDTDCVALIERAQDSTEGTERILRTQFQCEFPASADSGDPSCAASGSSSNAYSSDDIEILRHVCATVTHRAAQLLAVVISALLNRMDAEVNGAGEPIVVAIDGSVYKHHERLRDWLNVYTRQWAPARQFEFILAEDGSGKGAALVAAIAVKQGTLPA